MSQLAKRISPMLHALQEFRNVVESLPFQSEPAHQHLKQINEALDVIERERTLILSEPLPATYTTTDRIGWEYDVRANTKKLDENCRETLRIAMESQKKINSPPNDPQLMSKIQLEMRDRCRDIDEIGKKLSDLRAAIDEAALVETDLVKLLWATLQDGEGFIKAGHFERIFKRHDAHYQQRFLINVFVNKGYLQLAQLPDGVHEETWMIVADTVKAALGKLTGDLSAYFAELRTFEDECYAATEGRSVIGLSCWNVGRSLTKLREIDARHGVQRDDPRVYSIAAYRREREAIRRELDNLLLQAAANADDQSLQARWWRCEVRLTDCSARHFPGLNLLDGESVDSTAKLWAYIVRGVELSELAERVPGPSVHQKTLREVYKAMHRIGLTWAPCPLYGSLPDDQVVEKLLHIANRLAEEECTETPLQTNVKPQPDQARLPTRTTPLSRTDLPRIAEAIRELHRIIEHLPAENWKVPAWLVEQYKLTSTGKLPLKDGEKPNHAWLIGAAATEVLNRLTPPFRHIKDDCPEITESSLDQRDKIKLIELRELLLGFAFGENLVASNRSAALKVLGFLESVLKQLNGAPLASDHTPKEADELTDRQRMILETMLVKGVTSKQAKLTRDEIARLINPKHEAQKYAHDFANVKKNGYTDSGRGADGGVWLTAKGIEAAEENSKRAQ